MTHDEEYHLQASEIMIATKSFRQSAFAFITEGSLALRPLGHYDVDEPIPNGESAITALEYNGRHRKVYGATSGTKSHLFYYDPSPAAEHVVDIGVMGEDSSCAFLTTLDSGDVIGMVNPAGSVFRYNPEGEYSLIWKAKSNDIHFLPMELGPMAVAVRKPGTSQVYAILQNTGELVVVDVDEGTSKTLATIEKADKSNAMAFDGEGNLWGSCAHGLLFRYATEENRLDVLDLQLPSPRGMEFLNFIDSLVWDGEQYLIGGTILGTLFKIDPRAETIKGYGRAISDHRIRSLVVGKNGLIYGCAGTPGKNSHLFVYNPVDGEIKDLGIPMVHFPKNWIGYQIACLAVGRNGEVYLGEADRISHLFIYYPPVVG